ncbi:hypothetical protein BN874_290054 [Candidatus Contendobacter odensis Run_B_J11]|uniref:Uncharacterized protein n=1 Tax=Candidatus Contendobacter odensis Run_B_J11 TaxID=1400861 RepID=A0A7U7J433_9GAMM|nr:hypothetical protein BN874_290054 [Candidatus Contendobacter odensis Run_B_J11]
MIGDSAFQPYPTPATFADSPFIKQFHTNGIKRGDQFDQGINIATDDAVASLHPLDSGQGQSRYLREHPLIHA